MGFFDDLGHAAQGAFDAGAGFVDKGVEAAGKVVSGIAVEQQAFARAFGQMCSAAAARGWHEANGGNCSLKLDSFMIASCRQYFRQEGDAWVALPQTMPELSGSFIFTTRSGSFLRNVAGNLRANAGIVEVSEAGDSWRMVWGFGEDGSPTSELAAHLLCFAMCQRAGRDISVVYHAHPANLIALSMVDLADSRAFTRMLWKTQAECVVVAPRGVAVLPWLAPGSEQLAQAVATASVDSDAVVAQNHGVFTCGESVDAAFNVVETLDKAAGIRLAARAACSSGQSLCEIPDSGIVEIAERYKLPVQKDYL